MAFTDELYNGYELFTNRYSIKFSNYHKHLEFRFLREILKTNGKNIWSDLPNIQGFPVHTGILPILVVLYRRTGI